MKTTGHTVLITGAGTGIGLEAAKLFDQRGNTVIMVARDGERLTREAAKLQHADPYRCDIADPEQVDALLEHVRAHHPALDVLFLNAGVTHTYQLFGEQDAVAHATAEVEVNYLSAVRLTQLFEPLLREQQDPAMIITTSGTALVPDVGNPTYSATKAALHSLCQTMRFVLGRAGSPIRVFEVMAPLTDSPFAQHVVSDDKVPPSVVAQAVLDGLEADDEEMHVGATADLYPVYLSSPHEALVALNASTGG